MKDNRIYLLHARDAIRHIVDYTAEGKDAFLTDRKTQDAVPLQSKINQLLADISEPG